jgi:perosamine synthetase
MSELAVFGGNKTIQYDFPLFNTIGKEEELAVQAVMQTGVLSRFLGAWDPDFFGGEKVQAFERAWEAHFRVKHAVSVNSNTSGLMAALGAIGLEPGDEVIVSPWTMSASATAILVWNAIPVFADIEPQTYNLDPKSIEKNISPRTKAIMVTDIFGHAADLDAIMAIAKRHKLKVIEDAAQAPGALYHGQYVGTVADIGVFSLNYHKHIHTGEGGMCVTNDPVLAERMQLIRNHAESVVEGKGVSDLSNMIGFNFRLGEIEAAIGLEQLKKLTRLVEERQQIAEKLKAGLKDLPGLQQPITQIDCSHVYYVFPMIYDQAVSGVHKDKVVRALQAEGVKVGSRYCNIHLLPMYQKRIAYGSKGYPWVTPSYTSEVSYKKGICPVAESLQADSYMGIGLCAFKYEDKDIDAVIKAFHKVWKLLPELKALQL